MGVSFVIVDELLSHPFLRSQPLPKEGEHDSLVQARVVLPSPLTLPSFLYSPLSSLPLLPSWFILLILLSFLYPSILPFFLSCSSSFPLPSLFSLSFLAFSLSPSFPLSLLIPSFLTSFIFFVSYFHFSLVAPLALSTDELACLHAKSSPVPIRKKQTTASGYSISPQSAASNGGRNSAGSGNPYYSPSSGPPTMHNIGSSESRTSLASCLLMHRGLFSTWLIRWVRPCCQNVLVFWCMCTIMYSMCVHCFIFPCPRCCSIVPPFCVESMCFCTLTPCGDGMLLRGRSSNSPQYIEQPCATKSNHLVNEMLLLRFVKTNGRIYTCTCIYTGYDNVFKL